ncbi:methyl-accepting chemotaxis protein [Alkalinema pantanalense CENA528]|uniref:methyl-accepting chemotaxis protein n=1 Tax=Alkalinema pantanalense TaxID=1620705 RepID=UPI003D6E0845
MSLKTKATILAITIGTLPVFAIGGVAYWMAERTISEQISQAGILQAQSLSDKINRFMNERLGAIIVLSGHPALVNERIRKTVELRDLEEIFNRFVKAYGVYDSVAAFDMNGDVIAQSAGDKLDNHRSRAYFQQVLATRTTVITPPEKSISTGKWVIHIAAPLLDDSNRNLLGVIRTRIPIEKLREITQFLGNGQHYHITDAKGNIFVASDAHHADDIGKNITEELPPIAPFLEKGEPYSWTDLYDGKPALFSYAPVERLAGLDLRWNTVLSLDGDVAFAAQKGLLTTILIGTGLTALAMGLLAAWLAQRLTKPLLEANQAVQALGAGKLDTRIHLQGQDELAQLGNSINDMADQLSQLISQQVRSAQQASFLSQTTLNIRRSLRFEDIFQTSVEEVRNFLQCDRVVIYSFAPDFSKGTVIAESVLPGWPIALGQMIADPLTPDLLDRYRNGRVWSIDDRQTQTLTTCHCEILEALSVRGNLVAPVMHNQELIALICAHQCDGPRVWNAEEIDLFKQLAVQIGFALDQAHTEQDRQKAEVLSEERRRQRESLQRQLLELLSNIEGAAMGNLTVRADVSAGDIGTVADFFNSIIESLRSIVLQVKQSATQVNEALTANEAAITHLADESNRQAKETARTLDSLSTMTQSIYDVANNAQQAAAITRVAADNAQAGGAAMESTVSNIAVLRWTIGETAKKVKRLGESSQEISKVISMINQIAMQTNLLAINAGIEAARAGEDGQGFAVVAEEVAELANRATAATREIESIVSTIQRETAEVVDAMEQGTSQVVQSTTLVNEAKENLGQVVEVAHQVDELVQKISEATISQVQTATTVSDLMRQMAQFSSRTSDSSKQVSATLRQTLDIAQDLKSSVGTFIVD